MLEVERPVNRLEAQHHADARLAERAVGRLVGQALDAVEAQVRDTETEDEHVVDELGGILAREAERLHDLLAQGVEQLGERLAQGLDPRIRRVAIPAAEEQLVEVRLLIGVAHEPQPEFLERGPVVQRLG